MSKTPKEIFEEEKTQCKNNSDCIKQASIKLLRETALKNKVWPWINYDWDYSQYISNTSSPEKLGITSDPTWKALFNNAKGFIKLGEQVLINPNPPSNAIAGKTDALNCVDFGLNACQVPSKIREECKKYFVVGQKIKARWKGRGTYYKGNITKVNKDGTYDIKYTDGSGDTEKKVSKDLIIPDGGGGGSVDPSNSKCNKSCVDINSKSCNVQENIKNSYKDIKPVYSKMKKLDGKSSSSYYIQTGTCPTELTTKEDCDKKNYQWLKDSCVRPKYAEITNTAFLGSAPSLLKDIAELNPLAFEKILKGEDTTSFKSYSCDELENFQSTMEPINTMTKNPFMILFSVAMAITLTLCILSFGSKGVNFSGSSSGGFFKKIWRVIGLALIPGITIFFLVLFNC